jgi:hypothetical protein
MKKGEIIGLSIGAGCAFLGIGYFIYLRNFSPRSWVSNSNSNSNSVVPERFGSKKETQEDIVRTKNKKLKNIEDNINTKWEKYFKNYKTKIENSEISPSERDTFDENYEEKENYIKNPNLTEEEKDNVEKDWFNKNINTYIKITIKDKSSLTTPQYRYLKNKWFDENIRGFFIDKNTSNDEDIEDMKFLKTKFLGDIDNTKHGGSKKNKINKKFKTKKR